LPSGLVRFLGQLHPIVLDVCLGDKLVHRGMLLRRLRPCGIFDRSRSACKAASANIPVPAPASRSGFRPPSRRSILAGTRPRSPAGDPMTLGNRRANGVRSLDVSCWVCHHRAILSADPWPDHVPVPSFGPHGEHPLRHHRC
jgi:hypothetical protein